MGLREGSGVWEPAAWKTLVLHVRSSPACRHILDLWHTQLRHLRHADFTISQQMCVHTCHIPHRFLKYPALTSRHLAKHSAKPDNIAGTAIVDVASRQSHNNVTTAQQNCWVHRVDSAIWSGA